jgi:hypothetical protein
LNDELKPRGGQVGRLHAFAAAIAASACLNIHAQQLLALP